ncbi:MAG: type III secretion system chaperone [Candidimonas sp.]
MSGLDYSSVVKELARHMGLAQIDLQKTPELEIDGVAVALSGGSDAQGAWMQGAALVATLGRHRFSDRLGELLLQANTLGPATQGATFGMDFNSGHIVLARRLALDTPVRRLAVEWCRLAQAASAWAAAIENGTESDYAAGGTEK